MAENCPYAYRKPGDQSVHCRKSDWCAAQYYCRNSRRWEAAKRKQDCPVRAREDAK